MSSNYDEYDDEIAKLKERKDHWKARFIEVDATLDLATAELVAHATLVGTLRTDIGQEMNRNRELRDELTSSEYNRSVLAGQLAAATGQVDGLDNQLDTAREAVRNATLEHNGCPEGKKDFLRSTGLWTPQEVNEMFTLTVRYEVNVSGTITFERELDPSEEGEDIDTDDLERYIDDDDVDTGLRDWLDNEYLKWNVIEAVQVND